jgi:hypothetical protein
MSTTFTTTYQGQTATRTSQSRTYAYAVWAWRSAAQVEAVIAALPAVGTVQHTSSNGLGQKFYTTWTAEYRAERAESARRDGARHAEPAVAQWNSRYDLAAKEAARWQRLGWTTAITEVEVAHVTKPRGGKATAKPAPAAPAYAEEAGLLF